MKTITAAFSISKKKIVFLVSELNANVLGSSPGGSRDFEGETASAIRIR